MNFSKISKRFKSCQKNNALKDCGNFNTKNVFKEVSNKIFKGSENFSKIAQSWKFSIDFAMVLYQRLIIPGSKVKIFGK